MDLLGRVAVAQCVVEEKIVQLVGAYKVLGLLLDVSVVIGRSELR